ncbi:asparagine synthase (glutamine-hydrolyzing) [Neptuniibacter sp. QD48_55]|uniref:asparagine synthase (glutamine-hydrolyzing) n=1 Tax=Neptuniibacter sp. QD48_55 TaxID=3398212 RepID=UPI0039F49462
MCGIVGAISETPYTEEIRKSLEAISHRGPDNQSSFVSNFGNRALFFGHSRLAIRDTSSQSNQPLVSDCSGFSLVYNGEIYNFRFLIDKYKIPSKFQKSDSLILFYLLIDVGEECLADLNGIFAFAFFDKQNKRFILARDAVGAKPIYYNFNNGELRFASELRALKVLGVDPEVSEEELFEAMNLGYVLEPRTGFSNITKVPPSHYLLLEGGNEPILKQYNPNISNNPDAESLVINSIKGQLVSDVPICSFFSGGVDSSVLALIGKTPLLHLQYPEMRDSTYASRIADYLGLNLHKFELQPSNKTLIEDAFEIADGVEEPIADYTFLASKQLSEHAQKAGYKVALSGMGADEAFGGYIRYHLMSIRPVLKILRFRPLEIATSHILKKMKVPMRKYQRLFSFAQENNEFLAYSSLVGYFSRDELDSLWGGRSFEHRRRLTDTWSGDIDSRLRGYNLAKEFDRLGFLSHNLIVADKSSMSRGVELRVPFLAEEIYFSSSPSVKGLSHLFRGGKGVLKNILFRSISKAFFSRPKEGFNPPLDKAVECLGEDELIAFFREGKLVEYISMAALQELITKHFDRTEDNTYKIWSLIFFEQWLRRWSN